MSRHISVIDIQRCISDLRAWEQDTCPPWARSLILSMADLIEEILVNRELEAVGKEQT